ncbi:DUF1329 domain-containing protein [Paraburkholderia adhaesiva]|uniref:DUF1329 domain-containing protein n=1 Tax=Paraburkholderia adhaesiva TaxID=2883244 RepID=UPI001F3A4908|nr:DUF1329 domain-containing protein [Paraburkholderia adhaesiva]
MGNLKKLKICEALCLVCAALSVSGAHAANLTPLGADATASADGKVPAWTGADGIDRGWKYGQNRAESWKYNGEKPVMTIDAANAAQYKDALTDGEMTLLKTIPGYKMEIYPTHRDCGVPDFVAKNTKMNEGYAALEADGWGMKQAYTPGIPFPQPKTGAEVMWNAKLRYRGLAVDFPHVNTVLSPAPGGGQWINAESTQTLYYPWGVAGEHKTSDYPSIEFATYFAYTAPAALQGQSLIVKYFLDKPSSETYYYFPGQRRVRRMPSYAYDAPQIGFEGQYTMDEPLVFNGTLDRFDWKIVGKREAYIPYNSFGAYDFQTPLKKITEDHYVNPDYRRYEMHRVWVVEATLKSGFRHIAPKRIFYVDEDSWTLLAAEDYDAQGKLFKYRESYLVPVYETGTCDATAFAQYNVSEGRYVFDMNPVGGGKDMHWITKPGSPKTTDAFYTQDNLSTISGQ